MLCNKCLTAYSLWRNKICINIISLPNNIPRTYPWKYPIKKYTCEQVKKFLQNKIKCVKQGDLYSGVWVVKVISLT